MGRMNDKALGGGFMDQADHTGSGQKRKGAKPFSTSWGNSRPLANIGSASNPGGKLSPKKLAGVGRGK